MLDDNRMIVDSTGSLGIYALETSDRGSYVCEVANEMGQAKQQYQVDVYGKISARGLCPQVKLATNRRKLS